MYAKLPEQYPAEVLAVFDRDAEMLGELDTKPAVTVGDKAPNFRLPDARGGDVELSDLLTRGPVVIVFYRGAWCPSCNLQIAAFQAAFDRITAAGASLVAISPQTPDASLSFAEQKALKFPVLSDAGNHVARKYTFVFTQPEGSTKAGVNLADFNGDDSNELPAPATFVISPDGTIVFESTSRDYRWRVGPEEVLTVLEGQK
jgi:peroxiredoxin